jgi:S-adenosylmethionine synthetase
MARKVAVETLKSTNSKEVLVEVVYVIGKPEPLDLKIKINGLETQASKDIVLRFQPQNIIKELELKKPQFKELSK